MKWPILAGLCFLIITIFTIPVFYEASKKSRALKVARSIAGDFMLARRLSLKKGDNCSVSFDAEQGSYRLKCSDSTIKENVMIKDISRDVVISRLFQDTGSIFNNYTLVFGADGKPLTDDTNKNSIYLININDEKNSIKKNVIRIFVDTDGRIDILKVRKVFSNGDLEFDTL